MPDRKKFIFSEEKSARLKLDRDFSFTEIIAYIESGYLVDVIDSPHQERYPGQKIYVVDIKGYIWLVPHDRKDGKIILRTAFPSRKATKAYLKEDGE